MSTNDSDVSGFVNELSNIEKLKRQAHDAAKDRKADLPSAQGRICCRCGKPSTFTRTNPGLTSQVWCEPCYHLAVDADRDHDRFLGHKTNKAYRHHLHQQNIGRR